MKTLLTVLVLAIAAPASAAWRRIDSPHFVIVGDASARDLRSIAARFEGFHETLRRLLSAETSGTPVPTVVVVFPSDEAFTPFKPLYQGKPKPVAGYAGAGRDLNQIAMVNIAGFSDRLIFHEYTHMIVANAIARAPIWLNEGLAEFYSTFALMDGGKRAQIGLPINEHLRLLNGSLRVPMADLLKVDAASPLYNEESRISDFYAESWALIHMLINAEPSRIPQLGNYLQRVNEGADEKRAWEEVFGTGRIEGELRLYLTRRIYKTMLLDFAEEIAALPVTESVLSPADAAAFLAWLQLRNLGADAAARILEPALKNEPANALANVAMAQLELGRQDAAAAEKRLMALPSSKDWFVAYSAGVALTEAVSLERGMGGLDEALAKATQLVEQARRDRPDLPNALAQLVRIELLSDTRPSADAKTRIARARTMAPGHIEYALLQAEVFARAGEYANARAVVGPLMTSAYPENVRNAARRLMGGLVDLERASNLAAGRAASPAAAAAPSVTPPTPGPSRSVAVPDADAGRPRDTTGQGRFVPAYRSLQAGEQRLDGMLERIDCGAGGKPAVFHVRASGALVDLEGQLSDVDLISYRDDLTGGVSCGERDPMRVYVTWRDGTSPRREKVVVAIEFLPKD